MKVYEMELVIKDCQTQFKEGFSPGGLVKQVVVLHVPNEAVESWRHLDAVDDAIKQFLRNTVEVRVVELDSATVT